LKTSRLRFVQQDLASFEDGIRATGRQNLELTFEQKVPIAGYNQADDCWQVMGRWQNGILHQFNIYFPQENIQGTKGFSCNEG